MKFVTMSFLLVLVPLATADIASFFDQLKGVVHEAGGDAGVVDQIKTSVLVAVDKIKSGEVLDDRQLEAVKDRISDVWQTIDRTANEQAGEVIDQVKETIMDTVEQLNNAEASSLESPAMSVKLCIIAASTGLLSFAFLW